MRPPIWYKWVILIITSISTLFAFGYITTTTSIGTIYYIQRYNERIISGLIGPVQIGLMLTSFLPSLILCRRVGFRITQLIGAVLLPTGLVLTSFTTESWQGLLLSGVCAGIGGALMQVATTQTIKAYFSGTQIAPFGAVCLSMNTAAMVFPQIWRILMSNYGWNTTFYVLGGMTAVGIPLGLTFIQPPEDEQTEIKANPKERKPKLSLVLSKRSSTVFLVEALAVDEGKDKDVSLTDESSFDSAIEIPNETASDADKKLSEVEDQPPSNTNNSMNKSALLETLKKPQSLALLLMSGLYSGGITAGLTVVGDYAELRLGIPEERVALGLTIQGAAQIVASFLYMFLTFCTEFCATLLHSVCMFIMCGAFLGMCFASTEAHFMALIAVIGFAKAITTGNSVPLAQELVGAERMMDLYVLKAFVDGFGSAGVPFLAVYMQESLDPRAALYLCTVSLFLSGSVFVPFYRKYIHKPKVRSHHEAISRDDITTTNVNLLY